MIKIEKLTKRYLGDYALKNATFEVATKETVAIVGPSGSGKTTLLRCINHLDEPTSGSVFLNATKITKNDPRHLRLKIGMVFQHCNLFPHMNVMENLIYSPCRVLGHKISDAEKKALQLLEHFSIKSKAQSMPNNLSGGQKQRFSIATTLIT